MSNYLLVLLIRLYAFIRRSARRQASEPKTYVVVNLTRNIGDMVCTTPIFRAIKVATPGSKLIVVGSKKNSIMMEGNTDIDRYIVYDDMFWSIVRELQKERIDIGILINPGTLDFGMLFLGNVKQIASFAFDTKHQINQSKSFQFVSGLGHTVPYTPGKYVPQQYLNLLKPFSIDSTDVRKHLGYTSEGEHRVTTQLASAAIGLGEKIIAIAPGAGTKIKQWPAERFGEVANFIAKKYGMGIAIIGGPRDIDEIENMKSVFNDDLRYYNFADQSLDELKATLSKATLIIGNDSGPIYIAESFGAGTLVLIGPTDEAEHPLQDATHRIVMGEARGTSLLQSYVSGEDTIDLEKARAQIEAITVSQVCAEIDDVFRIMKIEPVT